MRFVKDKQFDRIITLNKGKICSKIRDLQKRHQTSVKLYVNLISEFNGGWNQWRLVRGGRYGSADPEIYLKRTQFKTVHLYLFFKQVSSFISL
jgi:hypothetical protein